MNKYACARISHAIGKAVLEVDRKHLLAFSGSLAYYYFLSLVPFLILLASALAYFSAPSLFEQVMLWMSYIMPVESMILVRKVFSEVMASPDPGFFSFGIVGTLWTASGASATLIEALNLAYGVEEGRPFWHTRLLAIGITLILGTLASVVLAAMFLGPIFAVRIAHRIGLDPSLTHSWSYFRWLIAICLSVFAVEICYYLAPNVKQRRFWRTVPGSIVAVTSWIAASYCLGLYLQHVDALRKSYGTLGAVAGLLLWFYVSSAAILIGAEVNAELLKAAHEKLPVKEKAV